VAGISLKGEKVLRRIATETGGRVFMPTTEGQLELVHNALADDVQNRYLITYTPANQAHDGKWRDISVVTGVPEYRVKARPGYFAPKPAPVRPSLEFTATDLTGQYLDVAADDLEIVEDGVPQTVETFHEASQPVSIVLALDASGSMRHKEADVIASAHAFTNALRPQDQLAVMMFADSVVMTHDLSTNRDATKAAINDYKTSGGTALYDALGEAMARLQRAEGRRVVVVLSDGRDEDNPGTGPGSVRKLSDVLDALKQTGAVVFPIGLGTKVDAPMLEKLAELSGGRAMMPQDVSTLGDEFQRVVEDLRRRYVVGYTSTNAERNGKWRDVEIRVKAERQITVRSLGGYNAPER
jgi:VWFA-related protein